MTPTPFAVIFDMDGTLLQTEEILVPALEQTFHDLRSRGHYTGATPIETYKRIMGVTLDEVWRTLLPEASDEIRQETDHLFLQYLIIELREGRGKLFPQVEETLAELKALGHTLYVASNGLEDYIAACNDAFHLARYFTDFYSAGRFQTTSKTDLVRQLKQSYGIQKGVLVGDRKSDVDAAKGNDFYAIGVDFGFAIQDELRHADEIVTRFEQIIPIIRRVHDQVK
jgi:adenosylhomocysteine nucleosidase